MGTVPETPSQRPPGAWAVAHSLAPFPSTTPSPLSPLFPGLRRGWKVGEGIRDSWANPSLYLRGWIPLRWGRMWWGLGLQRHIKPGGPWYRGRILSREREGRMGWWGTQVTTCGWVYCPPRPRAPLCPGTLDLRPWTLSWAAKGSQPLPGLPGCNHARKREKWLPLTFLLKIAMPKKAPGRDLVLALLPSRIAMNPEFGSEKETGFREVRRLGSPSG